jgi:plastocyanin
MDGSAERIRYQPGEGNSQRAHPMSAEINRRILLLALAVLPLAGCGSSSGSSGTGEPVSSQAARGANAVSIKSFAYHPATLTVARGTRVTFTNRDDANHTATASGFDSGTVAPGKSRAVVLRKAGTFAYTCRFHPFMHGTLKVTS